MNKLFLNIKKTTNFESGFSVIEVLLAAALFIIFSSGIIAIVLQGFDANRLGNEETIANEYASEGIEAAKSIKNQAYTNIVDTAGTGVIRNGSSVWAFSGANNTFGKYTRVITVTDVLRDASGNIVASGGSFDPNTKKVTSTVSWSVSPTRNDSVVLTSYLTNWKGFTGKGGMVVYGDGGTTTDAIKYRILDGATGTWSTAAATADVDSGSTNKALRAAKLYASSTRNEKILISRHYNGTAQFIYAQVWNGTSWGNVVQLATWTATTFLDVQNFDGTYLNDGTFMVIYSDNTIIPKYQIWNGTSWSGQSSLTTLGTSQIPSFIVARARPGTNEVMAAFFTQGSGSTAGNTITEYWSGSAWSAITTHATAAPLNTKKMVDFAWSPIVTTGALVYADSATDKNLTTRIFVANGTGGGSWGTAVNAGTAQTNNLGSLTVIGRPGINEFQACNKDAGTTPTIICQKITFSGNVPTITNPTNATIASATDAGIQKSYDIGFESLSGDPALAIYSDNTAVPKIKKYTASTSTWDAAATTIATGAFTPGAINSVRIIPQPDTDDIMGLIADANFDLYSVIWDGTNNILYTAPVGKAFSQHGTNGSATTDFWYDFAWNKF